MEEEIAGSKAGKQACCTGDWRERAVVFTAERDFSPIAIVGSLGTVAILTQGIGLAGIVFEDGLLSTSRFFGTASKEECRSGGSETGHDRKCLGREL